MNTWQIFANIFGRYYTLFVVIVGHVSFLLICFGAAWTSPVLTKLSGTEDNPLGQPISDEESDRIGSVFYVGATLGPLIFMSIIDKLGRKRILLIVSIIIPISYFILTFATRVEFYYICRILLGIHTGVALSIEPVYISEILAEEEREFLMSLVTIFSFTGILLAAVLGPLLSYFHFSVFISLFSFLFVILLAFGCPESPVYLIQIGAKSEARQVLQKLRSADCSNELIDIENRVRKEIKTSNFEIFHNRRNFKLFIVATIPLLLQQLSGMTFLVTYSQLIFKETNISISYEYCSMIVAGLQVSTTFLTPMLLKSKKFSIRSLLQFCLCGVSLCNYLMGFYFIFGRNFSFLNFLPLVILVIFVIFYNCGLDPIPWMLLGEAYPINLSSIGTALSTSVFLFSVFPMLYIFRKVDIGYLFLSSAFFCTVGIIYVKLYGIRKTR